MAITPSRELAQLEDKFCKDFNCCGLQLNDMHELLQHFEECHVVLESDEMDEDEDDLQFQFEGVQDTEMDQVQTPFSDMYLGSRKRSQSHQSVALADIYQTELPGKKTVSMNNPWQISDGSQTFPPPAIPEIEIHSDEESLVKTPTIKSKKAAESTDDEGKVSKGKEDRPYKCKIAGCNKSYKNPGGLKYHLHHGHCEDTGDPEMNNIIHKPYQCTVEECGKRYKNLNGLKVFFGFDIVSHRACSSKRFGKVIFLLPCFYLTYLSLKSVSLISLLPLIGSITLKSFKNVERIPNDKIISI